MHWFLAIVFLIFTLYNLSEAKYEKRLPSAVVVGTVYCDTCFRTDFSRTSHFISGFIWSTFYSLIFFLTFFFLNFEILVFFLSVRSGIGGGRMRGYEFETEFPERGENERARGVQSASTFLGIERCQENRGMLGEANPQQRALLFCGIDSNFRLTPSQVKKERDSHFLSWIFHFQAPKWTSTVQPKTKSSQIQGIQFQEILGSSVCRLLSNISSSTPNSGSNTNAIPTTHKSKHFASSPRTA